MKWRFNNFTLPHSIFRCNDRTSPSTSAGFINLLSRRCWRCRPTVPRSPTTTGTTRLWYPRILACQVCRQVLPLLNFTCHDQGLPRTRDLQDQQSLIYMSGLASVTTRSVGQTWSTITIVSSVPYTPGLAQPTSVL